MNKNKFHLGGHLPSWYDTDFLQNSMVEVIKGIMATLGLDEATSANYPYILSGCVNAGGTGTNIGAGYIYWNGEVYYHPAQTSVSGTGTLYIRAKETFSSFDPVPYATGGNQNVHAIRTVEFYKASTPTGSSDLDASLLTDISAAVIYKLGLDDRYFQSAGNYTTITGFISSWSSDGSPALRYKIFDGRLIMSGRAVASGSPSAQILVLSGLYISRERNCVVPVISGSVTSAQCVRFYNIYGGGGVGIERRFTATINDIVDFSDIDFLL